jgi:hypothetical protein
MDNQQVQNEEFRTDALAQLVKELGIDTLAQEKQDELMIKMTEVLLKRIFLETMEKLGDDGREAYEKLTEEEVAPEQVEEFFKERISDYDSMVQQVILEFKKEMTVPQEA